MVIRVWRPFPSDECSSYRLVARFDDPAVAKDIVRELTEFFTSHAKLMDAMTEDGNFPEEPLETQVELATKYGFECSEVLTWGEGLLEGDEPSMSAEGDTLVLYHTYGGGFGDLPKYLHARGARVVEDACHDVPPVSLFFQLPPLTKELEQDLAILFDQLSANPQDVAPFKAPWQIRWASYGRAALFRSGKTVGLFFPCAPIDLPAVKEWLAKHGIENPSLRLCNYADEKRFAAIATARCTSCREPLAYLEPHAHGLEAEHLACTACGGMFELKNFVDAG